MRRDLNSIAGDRRGVAAVEFALVCTLLFILLGGITDYGLALLDKSRLANAVAQGVQYAFLNPASSSSTVQTVVQSSSALGGVAANVTGPVCRCITGTTTPTLSNPPNPGTCTTACADGTQPGTYFIISANYSYHAILPGFSRLAGVTTISEAATVRVK